MSEFPTQGARPIWIASYPRSGNTFLRILLEKVFHLPSYSIYYVEGDTHKDPSAEALEDAPMLPRNWLACMKNSEPSAPVAIKTHDLPSDSAPAIFIARDGRAAIHSYYHYHKKFAFEQPSLTEIIAGACQFGSWSDHYWGWQPKTRPNTLLVLYDELVAFPERIVAKLATFLNRTPERADLPEFRELQKKLPAFFRRGQNSDYLKEWGPAHMALFNELHATAMADLGFPLKPSDESAAGTVKELARSATRLHRLYVDQLANIGRCQVIHQQEVQRLAKQIEESSGRGSQVLNAVLKNRWVRLGVAVGAVQIPSGDRSAPDRTEPATSRSGNEIKSSDENTRSSSRDLPPSPLSAPNGDISARG